ncbi:MAG: hypothetical protein HXX16_06450 [Bacteroidales bacterium]|nr:hypothetical protein [Bacteroidales bacterium]
MSGKESIRGYICQTIIAVLESLQNEWKYICIEPDTDNDKVDIAWTDENSDERIYQVKSSINDFGKTEILNYLLNLYDSNSSAVSFCVILVGNSTTSTKQYFKNIEDLELEAFDEKFKKLYKIKDKIKVDFYNLDLLTIKGAIISNIDRFLSINKINVDYFTKELIYGGLISQFMFFSTSGKKVSKSQFENELLSWFKHNYSKHLSKSNSELLLSFYLTGKIEFTNSLSTLSLPEIEGQNYIEEKKKELINLYERILKYDIKIEPEKEEVISLFGDLEFTRMILPRRSLIQYKNEPVIISDYEKKDISEKALKILKIKLPYEFFEFGELKESKNSITIISGNYEIILTGTDNEKAKKEAYDEFEINLENLCDLLQFWSEVRELFFLPIVLRNESKSYEKGLRIKLFLPKEIKIITPKEFPYPKRIDILKEFNSLDNLLVYCAKHQKDSKVNEFYSKKHLEYIQNFEYTYSNLAMNPFFKGNSKRVEQYFNILKYLFDYDIFYDNPDYTVLECEVNELSANESIALPSFIFYKSDKDFDIEYEINSKNLSKKINGVLNMKI